MTKREAEELIEIEIDGTEKSECTEERLVFSEFSLFILSMHLIKMKTQAVIAFFLWRNGFITGRERVLN